MSAEVHQLPSLRAITSILVSQTLMYTSSKGPGTPLSQTKPSNPKRVWEERLVSGCWRCNIVESSKVHRGCMRTHRYHATATVNVVYRLKGTELDHWSIVTAVCPIYSHSTNDSNKLSWYVGSSVSSTTPCPWI